MINYIGHVILLSVFQSCAKALHPQKLEVSVREVELMSALQYSVFNARTPRLNHCIKS